MGDTTAPIIRISFEFVQGTGGRKRQPGQGYLPILEIEGSEEVFGGVSYRFLDSTGDPLSENVYIPVEGSADVSALDDETALLLRKNASLGKRVALCEGRHPVAVGQVILVF